ncbi:MAG: S24/S26 family peptidase [Clostridia bacterium]|nr:S24/S26 family peptidase [Clostridia bacterium]
MSDKKSLRELEPELRAAINSGKVAEFETHGFSMIPLLHDGGDKVRLVKPEGRLAVGDVAFCVTDTGKYVLHRVIQIKDSGYILKGDNCTSTEFCKGDGDVIGVAGAFIRRGRLIDVNSFSYRFYCRFRKPLLRLWQLFWKLADRLAALKNK